MGARGAPAYALSLTAGHASTRVAAAVIRRYASGCRVLELHINRAVTDRAIGENHMEIKRLGAIVGVLTVAAFASGTTSAAASTATDTITGGTLAFVSTPADVGFSAVTLDGLNHTATGGLSGLDINDPTGSDLGWHVEMSGTSWGGFTGANLADTSVTATGASNAGCDAQSTCVVASNGVSYTSLTVPLGASPTPVTVYNAASNTGEGRQTIGLQFALNVPATTHPGAYASTWTVTLASAP